MQRRIFLTHALVAPIVVQSLLNNAHAQSNTREVSGKMSFEPLTKTKQQWKEILEPERFEILFRAGTERSGTSPLDKNYSDGTYVCAACNLPLFSSEHKFDSGTGWPSFTQPIHESHIGQSRDFKLIYPRTEYHCARCSGHQGHVFKDGPPPRGERWCNNGLALNFIADGEPLPELRT